MEEFHFHPKMALRALFSCCSPNIVHIGCDPLGPTDQAALHPFLCSVLARLSYMMSDHAANEKSANMLILEWRDKILNT